MNLTSPLLAELTSEQRDLRDMVRAFARQDVATRAVEIDRLAQFPEQSWRQLAQLGLLGVSAPEEYGGAGQGILETCLIVEELAAVCVSTAVTFTHQANLVIDNLARNASEELKRRYLPGLCDGSIIGCLAITEPEAGSDALSMQASAVKVDGGYVVNGTKTFITNAPVADLAMVYVRCKESDGTRPRLSLLAVPMDSAGVGRSRKFDKLGWCASPTGALSFDDCYVPDDAVVGDPGAGVQVLMSGLNSERLALAAMGIGLAQGALDAAAGYARTRRQFGRTISSFQLIQGKIADIHAGNEACRALTYSAARLADSGRAADLNVLASSAKLLSSELAVTAALEAVQVHGGYGYMKEFPVERYLRDAKMLTIGGGTSEIQRQIIAKALLGT